MRYENWDVLLFPEGSKVPIQEFKTQCFVTKDLDSPYLQLPAVVSPAQYYPIQGNVGQVPVLTTFVPSMTKDSPFRVSIHSWDKPQPSRFIERLMLPEDMLMFEARVFIDGVLVAGGIFGQRALWPYIIDFSSRTESLTVSYQESCFTDCIADIDRDGNQEFLRFPTFHPDILDQRHWDAGDPYGRIKVVIAEGFARPNRSPPFERVKDVISMSFQHAPLNILEYSNIAWPNPSMWTDNLPIGSKYQSTGNIGGSTLDGTPHGHSPTRVEHRSQPVAASHSSSKQGMVYNAWVSNRAFPVPASQWQRQSNETRRWGGYPDRFFEPFMGEQAIDSLVNEEVWNHRGCRLSREDVPMPDYSTSSGSRAISSLTGFSYEHSKQPSIIAPMDDEQYNELIQALTPTKAPTIGTRAPSNTPSAILAPTKTAAEVRPAATSRGSARTSALREISQPSTRDVSGSSNKSNPTGTTVTTPSKLGVSPSGNVKGKKEGTKDNTKETPKKSPKEVIVEVSEKLTTPRGIENEKKNDENLREDEENEAASETLP
ncbi:hypothetical protein N7478_009026 [Penicillium angulare]|uniref:uncharacterized protein n=1 Tax=Penicillium angulare TaxID=116970 RepID=UPI0025425B4B|nr:uncharacterized protein N7478_009026 [Penicillium angulare]KAJ5273901.1 hypothetical protein N7478_009026 [Penicillium angulare]